MEALRKAGQLQFDFNFDFETVIGMARFDPEKMAVYRLAREHGRVPRAASAEVRNIQGQITVLLITTIRNLEAEVAAEGDSAAATLPRSRE